MNPANALSAVPARLVRRLQTMPGASLWEALPEEESGVAALTRALAYDGLLSVELRPGDRVWLNRTASELGLGSGGVEFVIAPLTDPPPAGSFPGREAGHILKLRYTPLQHRVQAVEEASGPHRTAYEAAEAAGLEGVPVVATELLSQAAACVLAARWLSPELRIAVIWLDSASLAAPHCRLLADLRTAGIVASVITTGQAFGGDLECVGVHAGLLAGRGVVGADLLVATQGPGTVGTGTTFGFGGLCLSEVIHATAALGGLPILAARMSEGDARERHQGLSHHTLTIGRCLHAAAALPVPEGTAVEDQPGHLDPRQTAVPDLEELFGSFHDSLSTMGRSVAEDPLFFRAAAAAGIFAAAATVSG